MLKKIIDFGALIGLYFVFYLFDYFFLSRVIPFAELGINILLIVFSLAYIDSLVNIELPISIRELRSKSIRDLSILYFIISTAMFFYALRLGDIQLIDEMGVMVLGIIILSLILFRLSRVHISDHLDKIYGSLFIAGGYNVLYWFLIYWTNIDFGLLYQPLLLSQLLIISPLAGINSYTHMMMLQRDTSSLRTTWEVKDIIAILLCLPIFGFILFQIFEPLVSWYLLGGLYLVLIPLTFIYFRRFNPNTIRNIILTVTGISYGNFIMTLTPLGLFELYDELTSPINNIFNFELIGSGSYFVVVALPFPILFTLCVNLLLKKRKERYELDEGSEQVMLFPEHKGNARVDPSTAD